MPVVRRRSVTTSVDEAAEAFAATWSEAGFTLSAPDDDFAYVQDFVGAAGVAAATQMVGARLRSRSDESETLFVSWADRGGLSYFDGRHDLDADAGLLWSGRKPFGAEVDHAVVGSILLDRVDFEARARRMLASADFVLPDFTVLSTARHMELVRRQRDSLRTLQLNDSFADNPMILRAVTDATIAVVLAAAGLDVAEDRLLLPATVRRALTFIDENLHRPISLADIAAASGMSARGLQAAFQRALGETPMARVRRGRLAQAHGDLVAADAGTHTVAEIARRWGFVHLGRFAQRYRHVFGESPSQTLAR